MDLHSLHQDGTRWGLHVFMSAAIFLLLVKNSYRVTGMNTCKLTECPSLLSLISGLEIPIPSALLPSFIRASSGMYKIQIRWQQNWQTWLDELHDLLMLWWINLTLSQCFSVFLGWQSLGGAAKLKESFVWLRCRPLACCHLPLTSATLQLREMSQCGLLYLYLCIGKFSKDYFHCIT